MFRVGVLLMSDPPPKERTWPVGVGDEPWFPGTVENNPEVAKRLGEPLAEFATVETCLLDLLSLALGETNENRIASAILGPIMSITTRCDIVEGVVAIETIRTEMIRFVGEIRKANAIRNEYVHARYETHLNTCEVMMTTFAHSTTRRQAKKILTTGQLDQDIAIIQATTGEITNTLFQWELHPLPAPSPLAKRRNIIRISPQSLHKEQAHQEVPAQAYALVTPGRRLRLADF
jgi:hypothetical protein